MARKLVLFSVTTISLAAVLVAFGATGDPADDSPITAAICPIVYRLDESPSSHGYHYTFYGNAFFINDEGYLLTAGHVVETFRNGGQPSIQITRRNRPPQLLPITVVATDSEHDVAILRATPNPFTEHYSVAFLLLAKEAAVPGQRVLALSLHPVRLRNAQSFQMPAEDRSAGEVLSLESTQLDKSSAAAEILLLSHPVTLGQSGSPVLAADSRAVVGLVEGRWLRSSAIALTSANGQRVDTPGAAIPIRYALALLDQKGVHWNAAPRGSDAAAPHSTQ